MIADPDEKARPCTRVERLIEHYRRLAHRRLLRRARRVSRDAAMYRQLSRLEAPPEREH
jgi:hypothetical protein